MRTSIPPKSLVSWSFLLARAVFPVVLFAAALTCAGSLSAQTTATPPATSSAHPVHHKHPRAAAQPAAAPAPVVQAVPAAPQAPHWPINDRPAPASVTWDSRGLHIDATNASLQQILLDVASVTGAKVEGMGSDERVFGNFGPGQARDVLSQLLSGSGYNVLLVGDQGQGTPRQILLSTRHVGNAISQPAMAAAPQPADDDSADNDDDQPTPVPSPIRPVFGAGGPNRPAQPITPDTQQRQQQQPVNNPQPE
jgi:hypothetical protein